MRERDRERRLQKLNAIYLCWSFAYIGMSRPTEVRNQLSFQSISRKESVLEPIASLKRTAHELCHT